LQQQATEDRKSYSLRRKNNESRATWSDRFEGGKEMRTVIPYMDVGKECNREERAATAEGGKGRGIRNTQNKVGKGEREKKNT